jgi:hypothetical protein
MKVRIALLRALMYVARSRLDEQAPANYRQMTPRQPWR